MKHSETISPILKWAGGKRQLLPRIRKALPDHYNTYYEPFVGGGAVLFDLQPQKVIINDSNQELINLYRVVKNDVQSLIEDLKKHKTNSSYFYQIRALDRDIATYSAMPNIEKASRIIYLNKTCYNGLFRVNQAGEFNAPFGKYKNPDIINEKTLKAVSKYFNSIEIDFRNTDFSESVNTIKKGDFVYFDPPYDPLSNSSSFTSYAKGGFNKDDQIRLKNLCDTLTEKGVNFLLSNSSTDFILNLYQDYKIEIIQARRSINANGNNRGKVAEVLVKNYNAKIL